MCLEKISRSADNRAVLSLQYAAEAFFLAHALAISAPDVGGAAQAATGDAEAAKLTAVAAEGETETTGEAVSRSAVSDEWDWSDVGPLLGGNCAQIFRFDGCAAERTATFSIHAKDTRICRFVMLLICFCVINHLFRKTSNRAQSNTTLKLYKQHGERRVRRTDALSEAARF